MLTKTKNRTEKIMPARDGFSIAKDIKDIESDVLEDLSGQVQEDFEKTREKGEDIFQWLERQSDDYFKRLMLSNGGVVDLAKYRKSKQAKIKKLNLAEGDYDRAVADITSESDRDLIKKLLKMSGINIGKGDK